MEDKCKFTLYNWEEEIKKSQIRNVLSEMKSLRSA